MLTIAYISCRKNPRFEWFLDSLAAQTTREQQAQIELIFIDGHLWHPDVRQRAGDLTEIRFADGGYHDKERRKMVEALNDGRFKILHIPPKPNAYQGPWRQTSKDFFCAGSTRNTAFIVANSPYIMFCDDLAALGEQWYNQVRHAAQDEYILAGVYRKVVDLKVASDGRITDYKPHLNEKGVDVGFDSRWGRTSDKGAIPWHGSGIYGCSFGVPLEAALEVDGNDNACDLQGGEDCDFGTRLERASWPVYINRNCLTLEDEGLHHDGSKLEQRRLLVDPSRLPKAYESYRHPVPAEMYWSDHVMVDRLHNEPDRTLPLVGSDLRALRLRYEQTGLVPVPAPGQLDWRTGEPLNLL